MLFNLTTDLFRTASQIKPGKGMPDKKVIYRHIVNYLLLFQTSLFALFSVNINAQSFKVQEVKAALVGQIINNIEWQSKPTNRVISIAVYKDNAALTSLKLLESIRLKSAAVEVSEITSLKNAKNYHVLFVSKANNDELTSIVSAVRGTNTLVISEDSKSLHDVMINIVSASVDSEDKQSFSFQINRPNLTFERLKPLPNLVLIGGSELDVAALYWEMEQAVAKMRSDNQATYEQLIERDKQLAQKESQLTQLEQQSKNLIKRLAEGESALNKVEQQAKSFEQNALNAQSQYQQALAQAQSLEQKLTDAQKQFNQQSIDIEKQLALLSSLKNEINENKTLLQAQSSELEQKETQVSDQAQLISQKNQTIDAVLAIVVIFVIITFLVTYLLLKNRRINNNLKATVVKLETTQSQLVEAEKLAALGGLVAGVAHELNTPLGISLTAVTTIADDAVALKDKIKSGTLTRSELDRFLDKFHEIDTLIQSNLDRCHRLIQSFKQISSDQIVAESRKIKLKDYASEIMNTLSVVMRKNNVRYAVTGENPEVNIDPGILNQVLNNLTTNALTHAFKHQEDKQITIQVSTINDKAIIIFNDNGVGMDKHTTQKIFEPFFTTKRGKGGTGLGMNIVHNLVTTKLKGEISLSSELGKGSQFKISFPSEEVAL